MSLCYRCEHRAQFLENGPRPRYECGEIQTSKIACYMYRPVKSVVLARDKDDERPQFGPPIIASRSYFVRIADEMELSLDRLNKDESILYWKPRG